MTHIFKRCGQRVLFDTDSCTAHRLSPLAVKIIDSLNPPLSEICPSPLRYAFAKYDSQDVASAYGEIYKLYKEGHIFKESGNEGGHFASAIKVIDFDKLSGTDNADIVRIKADSSELDKAIAYVSGSNDTLLEIEGNYNDRSVLEIALKAKAVLCSDKICVSHIAGPDDSLISVIYGLLDNGFTVISISGSSTFSESNMNEFEKVLKELTRPDGRKLRFLPFELDYISSNTIENTGCENCWAKNICNHSEYTPDCESKKAQIECALAYNAE